MCQEDQLPDSRLIALSQGGDFDAFSALVDRWTPRLVAFLVANWHIEANQAEDFCQEVWLRVWKGLSNFENRNFGGWLCEIARNLIFDHHRRKRPELNNEVVDLLASEVDLPDPRLDEIVDCRDSLDFESRELIRLRFSEGHTFEEIGKLLGVAQSEAHRRLTRCLAKLRHCVERDSK